MKIKSKTLIAAALISLVATSYALISCKKKGNTEDENFVYTLKSDNTYELTSAKHPLAVINIPEEINKTKITSVGKNAFSNQNQLTTVNISNNLESIDYAAFMNCEKLIHVNFAEDSHLKTIESNAFCNSNNLIIDYLPSSVTSIGAFAFRFDRAISLIYLPKELQSVGSCAFDGCNNATFFIEHKDIPEGWDKTWNNTNRPYLLDVNKEEGRVEDRGNFKVLINNTEAHLIGINNQSELKGDLVLPTEIDNVPVKSMISNLFSPSAKNSDIASLIVPDNYAKPDVHCFDGLVCANVYFMSGSEIDHQWIKDFEDIHNGSTAYINVTNEMAVGDCYYINSDGSAIATAIGNGASETITIANEVHFAGGDELVTQIAPRAFRNCTSVTKIDTSSATSLEKIGAYACYGCTQLTTANLKNVKIIGKSAFSGSTSMSALETVTADKVTTIGEEAFKKTSPKAIDIGGLFLEENDITSIGSSAFQNCLLDNQDIYLNDGLAKIQQYTFNAASESTTFHVSDTLLSRMKNEWGYKLTHYVGLGGDYYTVDSATRPLGNGHIVVNQSF